MVLRVEILGQGRCSARSRDVVGDGRHVAGLLEAGDDLLPYRLAARIDVVQVYRRGVRRARLPEASDGARQQPQHAAYALERLQRRGLRGQRLQDLGVQRPARPKALVARRPGERVRQLAPRRVRPDALPHRPAVGRIRVLAVDSSEADRTLRQERRVDELADAGHPRKTPGRVRQRDQAVRLAAAVRSIEAEDCRRLAARAAQAPADVGQQVLQAPGRIGVGEEPGRIDVLGASFTGHDLGEVGGEVRFGHCAAQDVPARTAGLENRSDAHRPFGIGANGTAGSRTPGCPASIRCRETRAAASIACCSSARPALSRFTMA